MSQLSDALGITDSAFTLLRDLIEQRLGVFYENGKRDMLADRLSQITSAHGMQSFLDYYYALKYDEDADRYWSELMDYLTVPETYFWRQPDHFDALVRYLVPEHVAKRPNRPLRIWSAACCSGEEPLSIAMALTEAGAFARTEIAILATDASAAMIARARRGVYGERAFRNLSEERRERYFKRDGNGWRVCDELHGRITYDVVNLMSERDVRGVPCADVVFCRNVLIYFSDDGIRRAAEILSRSMRPGGHLFLGAAETLTRVKSNFALTELGNAFVYVNNR